MRLYQKHQSLEHQYVLPRLLYNSKLNNNKYPNHHSRSSRQHLLHHHPPWQVVSNLPWVACLPVKNCYANKRLPLPLPIHVMFMKFHRVGPSSMIQRRCGFNGRNIVISRPRLWKSWIQWIAVLILRRVRMVQLPWNPRRIRRGSRTPTTTTITASALPILLPRVSKQLQPHHHHQLPLIDHGDMLPSSVVVGVVLPLQLRLRLPIGQHCVIPILFPWCVVLHDCFEVVTRL